MITAAATSITTAAGTAEMHPHARMLQMDRLAQRGIDHMLVDTVCVALTASTLVKPPTWFINLAALLTTQLLCTMRIGALITKLALACGSKGFAQ